VSYRFLEHRSDIIILGRNRTFEAALEDVGNGMFTQMGAEGASESDSFDIDFSAPTKEQLVVQLLTEVIAECETRPLRPRRMEVLRFDHSRLSISARVHGEKKIPENIIKAVTYHELRVEKIGGGWEIQVLFDI